MSVSTTTHSAEPDVVEQLADDVAAETLEYPEGCPPLRPVLALPRMRRADAYEALGHISAEQRKVRTADGRVAAEAATRADDDRDASADEGESGDEAPEVAPVELDPLSYGAQYRVIAYIEEYLAVVAVDEKKFRAWSASTDDATLVRAFNVYLKKTQPGEADSSTS